MDKKPREEFFDWLSEKCCIDITDEMIDRLDTLLHDTYREGAFQGSLHEKYPTQADW